MKTVIEQGWGSWQRFVDEFIATGMSARGWVVLCFDHSDKKLHLYQSDAQNQGAVWGSELLLPCDVYEHAYFADFGSDRKAYLTAFLQNVKWGMVEEKYTRITV